MRIEAKEGFTFKRIHDGFIMGKIIYLGIDYSTGGHVKTKQSITRK